MNDIITVFNRLTNSQLADCRAFEDILGRHYDKFKYFYYIIVNMENNEVDKITCKYSQQEITFIISLIDDKEAKRYVTLFKKNFSDFNDSYYKNYLDHEVRKERFNVIVRLVCKEKYKDEEDMYEERFNHQ
jgi:hypothetical protein